MAKILVGLLVYLFPIEVLSKILVILLRKIAVRTPVDFDDQIVSVLEERVGIKKEAPVEH